MTPERRANPPVFLDHRGRQRQPAADRRRRHPLRRTPPRPRAQRRPIRTLRRPSPTLWPTRLGWISPPKVLLIHFLFKISFQEVVSLSLLACFSSSSIIGHHNWITSAALCQASNWYVVTGAWDGVVKIWI